MRLPPYDPFPYLAGNKISLRKIESSDIIDLVEISFYNAVRATTLKEAIEMQDKINKDYLDGNSIHWGIADNQADKIIGTCGFYRGLDKGAGEIGCVLLPQHRGRGFMTVAMQLCIDFGINSIGLKRIWAVTTRQNDKANKLLTRLNFLKFADLQDDEIEHELISEKVIPEKF